MLIRPMRPDDVPVAEDLSRSAYSDAERFDPPREHGVPPRASSTRRADWIARTGHLLSTDPQGCWVAESGGQVVGVAVSFRRDLLWVLASYAVRSGHQGRGIGRPLLEAALTHARGCLRGMLTSSSDPKAYRRYRRAGFSLHPQLHLSGMLDRGLLPVVEHVREGTPADVDLMDSVDRQRRHAAHGPDHALLTRQHRLVVAERRTGSGYAYVRRGGGPALLAATDRRTASALLWECLAAAPAGAAVALTHVTQANEWAVDVGLAARLSVTTQGYLALRGMHPPTPYLHHGSLL